MAVGIACHPTSPCPPLSPLPFPTPSTPEHPPGSLNEVGSGAIPASDAFVGPHPLATPSQALPCPPRPCSSCSGERTSLFFSYPGFFFCLFFKHKKLFLLSGCHRCCSEIFSPISWPALHPFPSCPHSSGSLSHLPSEAFPDPPPIRVLPSLLLPTQHPFPLNHNGCGNQEILTRLLYTSCWLAVGVEGKAAWGGKWVSLDPHGPSGSPSECRLCGQCMKGSSARTWMVPAVIC